MALTPEDVVNKRFNPTKFREGYDQDEVDDFLDEVVVELRRLNQENEELRQRLVASDARISELQRSASQAPVAAAPLRPSPRPRSPLPRRLRLPPRPPADFGGADSGSMDQSNTNNLLQLARRLHEEHVREGMEKRDQLIAEGHATAARLVSEAETQQRTQIEALEQEKAGLEAPRRRAAHLRVGVPRQAQGLHRGSAPRAADGGAHRRGRGARAGTAAGTRLGGTDLRRGTRRRVRRTGRGRSARTRVRLRSAGVRIGRARRGLPGAVRRRPAAGPAGLRLVGAARLRRVPGAAGDDRLPGRARSDEPQPDYPAYSQRKQRFPRPWRQLSPRARRSTRGARA